MRVMVVENDIRTALALSHLLQGVGHQVIQYVSAPEAVRALLDLPCDLCFLGARLPGVDVAFAIRVLQEVAPGMPIILLGEGTPGAVEAALRAGAALVLPKPVGADALQEVVGTFGRERARVAGRNGEGPLSGSRAAPPVPGHETG